MKFFLSKSSQSAVLDRSRVNKDFYEFNKVSIFTFYTNQSSCSRNNNKSSFTLANWQCSIVSYPVIAFNYSFLLFPPHQTVLHGFPASPTCLAYDTYHKLLAIGTKNGTIQM